jgi:hypothetical protein
VDLRSQKVLKPLNYGEGKRRFDHKTKLSLEGEAIFV